MFHTPSGLYSLCQYLVLGATVALRLCGILLLWHVFPWGIATIYILLYRHSMSSLIYIPKAYRVSFDVLFMQREVYVLPNKDRSVPLIVQKGSFELICFDRTASSTNYDRRAVCASCKYSKRNNIGRLLPLPHESFSSFDVIPLTTLFSSLLLFHCKWLRLWCKALSMYILYRLPSTVQKLSPTGTQRHAIYSRIRLQSM